MKNPTNAPEAVGHEEILTYLRRFGRNTNSFLLAYGGCEWFRSSVPEGLVAYIRSGRTCVVAGDPLCAAEDTAKVLKAFSDRIGRRYRIALTLASGSLIPQLKLAGYGHVKVGSDPFFDLSSWNAKGNRAKKVRSAVNLARRSGVTVTAYRASEKRDSYVEHRIQTCTDTWLASRRGFSMRFFSAIRPLDYAEEKRHFLAWAADRLVGVVACCPIYGRNGWFIEDIVRCPDAPYGTSELLITTALKRLHEEGASLATMGIAPFAFPDIDERRLRARTLRLIVRVLSQFYNFGGVEHYRKKFAPSRWEPVCVAFWPDRVTASLLLDVANAIVPGGLRGLGRGWLAAKSPTLLAHPTLAVESMFIRLRPRLRPLSIERPTLDKIALGVCAAFVVALCFVVYLGHIRAHSLPATIGRLHENRGFLVVLTALFVFLVWRLTAAVLRVRRVGSSGNTQRYVQK